MNRRKRTNDGLKMGTSALVLLAALLCVSRARAGQLPVAYCTQFNKSTSCGSCGSASTGMGLAYVGGSDNPCDIQHWIYDGVSCGPGEGEIIDRANAYCSSHGLPSPCTTYYNWAGDPWGHLVAEIDAGRPFVAHVYQYGYHHYALVSGYSGSDVYISDSATSHLGWRSWGEFSGQWAQKNYDGIRFLIDRRHAPTGHLDSANCDGFGGWVYDADTPGDAVEVHIAFDGAGYDNAQIVVASDKPRADLCGPLGSCNHGFAVPMPVSMRNSAAHSVAVFGKDTQGQGPAEISGSPQSFTCDPPSIALSPSQGVLRPVASMEVFEAWRFSMLWDVAQYPDKALVDYSIDEDIPDKPQLVRSDDGAAPVWLLDGQVLRHVPSPEALAAWRFDSGLIATQKAAEVQAWRKGADLRAAPFLLKGSGSSIYVLDSWFRYESRGGSDEVLRESRDQNPKPMLRSPVAASDDPEQANGCSCRTAASDSGNTGRWRLALGCAAFLLVTQSRRQGSLKLRRCKHPRSPTRRSAP